jgi:nucleoside 2-deoxyribosyltransferase
MSRGVGEKMIIYFAGPLFSQAERIWNSNLIRELNVLIPNAKIVLPQVETRRFFTEHGVNFKGIVRACIDGIDSADVILAVLDGSDADSGTCWECGYAFAKGKRVIGLRTDLRGSEDEGLNAMLRRTCERVIYFSAVNDDLPGLAKEIASVLVSNTTR